MRKPGIWLIALLVLAQSLTIFAQDLPGGLQSKTDLPEPTMAIAYGMFIPGGGHFYLGNYDNAEIHDVYGVAFLATEVIAIAAWANGIKHRANANAVIGSIGFFALRFGDVVTATSSTIAYRKNSFR